MNTKSTAALIFFGVLSLGAAAGEPDAAAKAAQPGVTRTQVAQELRHAIANREIRHGDLADFHGLLETAASRGAVIAADAAPVAAATPATKRRPAAAAAASSGS